jgi:hypothetical protein
METTSFGVPLRNEPENSAKKHKERATTTMIRDHCTNGEPVELISK